MKCLDCGAEMEQGTAECVGAGFGDQLWKVNREI